jgi:hypothetical protein
MPQPVMRGKLTRMRLVEVLPPPNLPWPSSRVEVGVPQQEQGLPPPLPPPPLA